MMFARFRLLRPNNSDHILNYFFNGRLQLVLDHILNYSFNGRLQLVLDHILNYFFNGRLQLVFWTMQGNRKSYQFNDGRCWQVMPIPI